MKRVNRVILLLGCCCAWMGSSAQYDYGGQASFIHFFGPTGLKHFGAGVRGGYSMNLRMNFYGSFNYYLPQSYFGEVEVTARNGDVVPGSLKVPSDSRVSFMTIHGGFRAYFVGLTEGDEVKPWAVYGIAEMGLMFGSANSNIPDYDEVNYTSPIVDEVNGVFVNYVVGGGVGAELLVGKSYLYFDTKMMLTVDQANRMPVKTELPWSLNYNLGLRIPIDGY